MDPGNYFQWLTGRQKTEGEKQGGGWSRNEA